MALATDLMGVGIPAEAAVRIGYSDRVPLDGSGTSQGVATLISVHNNNVALGTSEGNTAFILPAEAEYFQPYLLYNTTAGAALIFPPVGDTIDASAVNAQVEIGTDLARVFQRVEEGRWISFASGEGTGGATFTGPVVVGPLNNQVAIAASNALTGTSSVAVLDISADWDTSAAPAAVKVNVSDTASAAGSLLLDLLLNGSSKFKVDKAGILYSGYTGIYRSLRNVPDQNNVFIADSGNDNLAETGTGLTGVGALALSQATEASDCTAVGLRALRDMVDGIGCTAIGAWSQAKNLTTGITSVGDSSMRDNTTGQENNAFGYSCMILSDTGSYNCAFGTFTLGDNRDGSYNSAFGDGAMRRNVSGAENVAVGYRAAYESLGNDQTAVGFEALRVATSGAGNTAVGSAAGWRTTTGANNVFLGHRAGDGGGGQLVTADNSIAIGYNAFTTKSNQAVLGNASVTETVLRGAIVRNELGADPADPAEGTYVTWMSNGVGAGDDGDIMVKITAGGVTKTTTLIDFSALP